MEDPRDVCVLVKQSKNVIHYCIGCHFHQKSLVSCKLRNILNIYIKEGENARRIFGCTINNNEHFIYKYSIKKTLKNL